jgi:hypothetical protein
MMLIGRIVSVPKKKMRRPENEKVESRRSKEKLIQLDDLILKKDVRGGRQLLFGAADTQQPTQIEKE